MGRYVLFDEIASGGMATVHLARLLGPVGFSRTVAVKRLHPGYAQDPDFVTMFVDEARLAARIRHPNVVPVLDVVRTPEELFLVMEYVQGESLSRLMSLARRRRTPISARNVVAIMVGVLHGLHAAHEATGETGESLHIVHRDVSPQNILVGSDGVPRVFDFGIAKARGRLQTTAEGQVKGKIQYMSPEQVGGGQLERAVDIYAAGVCLWEALTGRRLFEGETDMMLLAQVIAGAKEPPSRHVAELPIAIDEVTMRALAVDPRQRFATARDMALALEESFPAATALQLGEWVQQIATSSLRVRAQRVKAIESHPGLPGPSPESQPALLRAAPEVVLGPDGVDEAVTSSDVNPDGKTLAGPLPDVSAASAGAVEDDSATRLTHETAQPRTLAVPYDPQARRVRLTAVAVACLAVLVGAVVALVTLSPPSERPVGDTSNEGASAVAAGAVRGSAGAAAVEEGLGVGGAGGAAHEPALASATATDAAQPAASSLSSGGRTGSRLRPGGRPGGVAATPAATVPAAPTGTPTTPTTPTAPKDDCNPPYTIDARGIQRLKPQCL